MVFTGPLAEKNCKKDAEKSGLAIDRERLLSYNFGWTV